MTAGVTVIVTHEIKPGLMAAAAERIQGNGARMAAREGFIDRTLLAPVDGSEVLTTITNWSSLETYEAWVAHNKANNPHAGKESPFVASPLTVVLQAYGGEA